MRFLGVFLAVVLTLPAVRAGNRSGPQRNQRVIDEFKVTGRTRELPAVTRAAVPHPRPAGRERRAAHRHPGAGRRRQARLGTRCAARTGRHAGGAVYPEQTLGEELIVIVRDGSATVRVRRQDASSCVKDHVIYLQPGTKRSVKAGPNGWKAFEVYSPVRLDHLALAGQKIDGVNADVSRSGRDAVAAAWRCRESQRDPVDAGDRSRYDQVLPPQHRAVAADLGKERADQLHPHGSRLRVSAAHPP